MAREAVREKPEADTVVTLREAAHRFDIMAGEIGADTFHLFWLKKTRTGYGLVPLMDDGYPVLSSETKALLPRLPAHLADALASAACPFWWGGNPPKALLDGWSEEIDLAHARPGLALPLHADHGRFGAVVFQGCGLEFDSDRLMDVHGACHGLFSQVVALLPGKDEQPTPTVSRRELQCLKLTAQGLTSQEIAERLGLSVHTTNQYLANTTQKLNAVNRVHAVAKALRSGLID